MGYRGPEDPERRRVWAQARRAAALRSHPDRGGDADRLYADLAEVDRRYLIAETSPTAPAWQPAARIVRRARRSAKQTVRLARARIPSGWPGSRRYFNL